MDQFLKRHNLPKLTQKEIDNLNCSISIKEAESIIINQLLILINNNLSKQKLPDLDRFTGKLYQIFKGKINISSLQSQREYFLTYSMRLALY